MTFCIASLIYASMLMSLAITANANIKPWVYIALSIFVLFTIVEFVNNSIYFIFKKRNHVLFSFHSIYNTKFIWFNISYV